MKNTTPSPLRRALKPLAGSIAALLLCATASVFAGSAQWNAAPATGDWNTAGNWTPGTVPNAAADVATFGLSGTTGVSLSADVEVNGIVFNAGASAFTITPGAVNIRLTISGVGITNSSGITQSFVNPANGAGNLGSILFSNSASAGSMTAFTNNGAIINGGLGGRVFFFNTSTAGNGTFTNLGGTVSGANGGVVIFNNTSTAGSGIFTNKGAAVSGAFGGGLEFGNSATAANGTFTTNGGTVSGAGGGGTTFLNTSTAGSGTFTNNGGTVSGAFGGGTSFFNTSTAGSSTFISNGGTASGANGGGTKFFDTATAGSSIFTSNGGTVSGGLGGNTQFLNTATAGTGTFTTNGITVSGAARGFMQFHDTATAGSATFTTNGSGVASASGGVIEFFDTATAANGNFTNKGGTVSDANGGITEFHNSSTAGNGIFANTGTANTGTVLRANGGITQFFDTSTAASATFTNYASGGGALSGGKTQFFNSSTAGSATFTNFAGSPTGGTNGTTEFNDTSDAGSATLIANNGMGGGGGGTIIFRNDSTGGTATVKIFGSGTVTDGKLDISLHNAPGVTIGSLEGTGEAYLGTKNLTVGSNNLSTTFAGVLENGGAGTGSFTKIGTGTLTLTGINTYAGATIVSAGKLLVNGSLAAASAVSVSSGATLGGSGTIGAVTLVNNAILAPGNSPGTLTTGAAAFGNLSQLNYELGTPNVVGGGVNDLTVVNGSLTLDGVLNITNTGAFGAGTYRLFNYTGALTDNAVTFGTLPSGFTAANLTLQTSVANQINLIVTGGAVVLPGQFWDGPNTSANNVVDGGTGTWNNVATNWTNSTGAANTNWQQGVAVFSAGSGTATLGANITATELRFQSGSGAYTVATGVNTLTITGAGITNTSGITQNFVTGVDGAGNRGIINFTNSANAGSNTAFTNNGTTASGVNGGVTQFVNTSSAGSGVFTNNGGAASGAGGGNTNFFNTSSAGSGAFTNNGVTVSGALGSFTTFSDTSTAGSGTFTNNGSTVSGGGGGGAGGSGGTTEFFNTSSAGNGTFTTNGGTINGAFGGFTVFNNTSSAFSGTFTTNGGTASGALGGTTEFFDTSTASNGTFTNNGGTVSGAFGGSTIFSFGTVTAGSGAFTNNGGTVSGALGGSTQFLHTSAAGTGTFTNFGATAGGGATGGLTRFFDGATADHGTFINKATTVPGAAGFTLANALTGALGSGALGGGTVFGNTSTAASGSFTNEGAGVANAIGGLTSFGATATAGSGIFTNNGATVSNGFGGFIVFAGSATAGSATFTNNGGTTVGANGSVTAFAETSTAGSVTLIANAGTGGGDGGLILFLGDSTGGTARVIVGGNGSLDISGHNAPGVSIGSVEGSGEVYLGARNLTVGGNNLSTTFSGVIASGNANAGLGSLTKVGTGTLILSGANTYAGDTTINGGVLQVDGSILSANTIVNVGGTLGGGGLVGGSVVNGGTVSPGASPGTLHISGNYVQSSAGLLKIEIAGRNAGEFDVLAVGGTASLDGTLKIITLGGFVPAMSDQFTILTSVGSRTGQFSTVDQSLSTALFAVTYLPNSVRLDFVQTKFAPFFAALAKILPTLGGSRDLSDFGLTPNQHAVALALDDASRDRRTRKLVSFLLAENIGKLPPDFDAIAPEELASIFNLAVSLANVQTANLTRRMDDIQAGASGFSASGFAMNGSAGSYSGGFAGATGPAGKGGKELRAPEDDRWGVFVTGVGEFTKIGDTANASGYDLNTGGFTLGVDYRLTPNFALGVSAGYARTGIDLNHGGRITVDGGKLGLYATYFTGGFYADAAVSGGLNGYSTRRSALRGTARGSENGGELNALFATGYDWKAGALTLGPTASFQYTYTGLGSFTETGSLAPLHYGSQHGESLRSAVGAKASYDWKIGGLLIRPEVRAAWQHEYGQDGFAITSSFANGTGGAFTTHGPATGRDSLLLGAGFAILWSERISTYVYYDGEIGRSNFDSHNISGGVRVAF